MSWNSMPSEMKEIILKQTTKNTRLALGACSQSEKEFISSLKLTTLPIVRIGCFTPSMKETMSESNCGDDIEKFDSFVSFQKSVQEKLRGYHFVGKLIVHKMSSKINLQKVPNQRMLNVEELDFRNASGELMSHIMSQVGPKYLSMLTITAPDTLSSIFDTPQVMQCENLYVREFVRTKIREDQLLKLEARVLEIRNGIDFSADNFLKKCIDEANSNIIEFLLSFTDAALVEQSFQDFIFVEEKIDDGKSIITIDTGYPHLKLVVNVGFDRPPNSIRGKIDFDSEKSASLHPIRDNAMFRIINKLEIKYLRKRAKFLIAVYRANQPVRLFNYFFRWKNNQSEEAQRKLDEILDNTDCIKFFDMDTMDNEYLWKFGSRKNKLIIRRLQIVGAKVSEFMGKLMARVEPVSLKDLTIDCGMYQFIDCLDWRQVTLADKVELFNTNITDDQLLKMNVRHLNIEVRECPWDDQKLWWPFNGDLYVNALSEAGLNAYFKRCIQSFQTCDFYLGVDGFEFEFIEEELLEGLEIISIRRVIGSEGADGKRIVIKSPFEEYVLEMDLFCSWLFASRKLRSEVVIVRRNPKKIAVQSSDT